MLPKNKSHIVLKKAKDDPVFRKQLIDLAKTYDSMLYPDPIAFSKAAPSILQFASDAGFLAGVSSQADIDELITWFGENLSELAYYAEERIRIQSGPRYSEPIGKAFLSWTVKNPREREAMKGIRLALDFFNIQYFDYTSERMDDSKDNTYKIRNNITREVNESLVSIEIRSAEIGGRWIDFERREIEKKSMIQRIFICLDWTYAHFMQMEREQEERTLRIDMSNGHTNWGKVELMEQTFASAANASYYQSKEYYRKCFELGLCIRAMLEKMTIKGKTPWLQKLSRILYRSIDEQLFLQQALYAIATADNPIIMIMEMSIHSKMLLRSKSYREAIELLDKAIALSQSIQNNEATSNFYDDLSLCYSHLGQHDRAIEIVNQAISLVPDSRRLFTNKGLRLLRAKRFDEAEACAYKAMKLAPDDPSGKKLLDMVRAEKPRK